MKLFSLIGFLAGVYAGLSLLALGMADVGATGTSTVYPIEQFPLADWRMFVFYGFLGIFGFFITWFLGDTSE